MILRVLAQPKAQKSEIVGPVGEGNDIRLKIRLQAQPIEGEANEELLRFLKKSLKTLKPSRIEFIRGEQSRQKDVLLGGVSAVRFDAWLKEHVS